MALLIFVDKYALISLKPTDRNKSISIPQPNERQFKSAQMERILKFYYYMGVNGSLTAIQKIEIRINQNGTAWDTVNSTNQLQNEWQMYNGVVPSDTEKVR